MSSSEQQDNITVNLKVLIWNSGHAVTQVWYRKETLFLGHVLWFWVPRGLQIIADCNKLWFSVSAGVCCRGQKDKQGWRLAVWAQSLWGGRVRGTQRHFEGHTLVKIHRNSILQRLYLSLSTSREETSASSRAFFCVCETNVTLMDFCEERLLSILQWGFSHALKMSHSFSWIVSPRKTSWDPLYRQRENICLVPLSLCVQSLLSDNWEFVQPYFQHV